ncbi:hypothetical protein RI367_007468 [Sorochytrium milnesiophthora]
MTALPTLQDLEAFSKLPESDKTWSEDLSPFLSHTAMTSQLSAPWPIVKELIKCKILQIVSEEFARRSSLGTAGGEDAGGGAATAAAVVVVATMAKPPGTPEQSQSPARRDVTQALDAAEDQTTAKEATTPAAASEESTASQATTAADTNDADDKREEEDMVSDDKTPASPPTTVDEPLGGVIDTQAKDEINAQLRVIGECFEALHEYDSYATYTDGKPNLMQNTHRAPFTIQRLCELVMFPSGHYMTIPKYLRAIEKVLRVTSIYHEPDVAHDFAMPLSGGSVPEDAGAAPAAGDQPEADTNDDDTATTDDAPSNAVEEQKLETAGSTDNDEQAMQQEAVTPQEKAQAEEDKETAPTETTTA